MPDEPMTPRQVADEFGVTVRTVQRWISDGRLPAQRVGGRRRISRASLSAVGSTTGRGRPIRSLLIANRGEIAVRVARTARRLGIRAIGVHTADERAPDGVDEAHLVDSHLDDDALLALAARTGADAVHPGYGFLSENAAFARAVAGTGLTWVGPPAAAIAAMGDKAQARRRAAEHGVAVVPGYDGEDQSDERLSAEAGRVGFPLLVKPSAGGGGKGMRVVRDAAELGEALGAARREARRAFGDDRLVLERYLDGPRHVEIQVLFDAHGNGVHLGERDCSTQRRNQKIVEESPGPAVDEVLRSRMGEAALTVARAVGYVNAGTVEFLLADDESFHFLEMNTRLQVEHPVTELVTGRDLVADQLRIAADDPLGFAQADVRFRGHAMEARIYAEDPEAGFLPATGRLLRLRWPDGVRIDAGVREGDEVSNRFDPMLAKLIAHGHDRRDALDRLRAALAATQILGVRTNIRFLRWLLDQRFLTDGETRTDTLSRVDLPGPPDLADDAWAAAAAALRTDSTWGGGWRLNAPPTLRLRSGEEERSVASGTGAPPTAIRDDGAVHVDVEGQSIEFRLAPAPTVEEAMRHASAAAGGTSVLVAPMPGRVIAVRAAEGASVREHEQVVVIEAMKMEHAVVAPQAGVITRLSVTQGQQVQRGDVLAEVVARG